MVCAGTGTHANRLNRLNIAITFFMVLGFNDLLFNFLFCIFVLYLLLFCDVLAGTVKPANFFNKLAEILKREIVLSPVIHHMGATAYPFIYFDIYA
jgi:hypothetical protein